MQSLFVEYITELFTEISFHFDIKVFFGKTFCNENQILLIMTCKSNKKKG